MALLICLIALAFLAFAPASGVAQLSLTDWQDQSLFLRAAEQTLSQGLPDVATRMSVGQGYVAMTLGLSALTGLDPGQAMILLSRLAFVACAAVLAFAALRDRARLSIAFQVTLAAVVIAALWTSVWFRASDIPWTHFVAAALLAAMLVVSISKLPIALRSALIGALAITLMQTRMFEAMVVAIAGILIVPVAVVRHWQVLRARPVRTLLLLAPGLLGAAAAFVAVGLLSHNWSLYQQYSDQQSMVLAPQLAPTKAVQLFWDTCFQTLCDQARSPTVSPLADSLDGWRQPLLLQLPGLAGALGGLVVLFAARPRRVLTLPIGVLFTILTAGGAILAYVSGAPSGSPHLKYGFFRDFVAPLVLFVGAFIVVLARERSVGGRNNGVIIAALVVFFGITGALTLLRTTGLPAIPGSRIASLQLASTCDEEHCAFSLRAADGMGGQVPYSDLGYVTCDGRPLPQPIHRVAELTIDPKACSQIAIVPLATGLLLTPEDKMFSKASLDLRRPADTLVVTSAP